MAQVYRPARPRATDLAAAVLYRGGPVAAFMVVVVCLLAAVLVPLGWWRPEIVWPLLVAAALPVWWLARLIPCPAGPEVPAWTAYACLTVAVGFAVWAGLTHGAQVVVRRDAGGYALYAQWIATRHGLPVTSDLQAFGGLAAAHLPGFNLGSPAFYQVHSGSGPTTAVQVVPQFLLGAPALYCLGWWLAGWTGMFVMPAVLGGLGVLACAGVAARLIGPRWALPPTAAIALTQPVLHAARATYSEPPSMLLVLACAGLAADAGTTRSPRRARGLGLAAGLLLGLAGLIRVDCLVEVALVIPVCGVLALRRHPAAVPLAVGGLVGTGVAAVPAVMLSRPYLEGVWGSLWPLVIATGVLVVLSVATVAAARCRPAGRERRVHCPIGTHRWGMGHLRRSGAWVPSAAAVVLLIGAGLASRPLWSVGRHAADDPSNAMVAGLQAQQGLPVDGTRTYAEQSVQWLTWYVGPLAAIAALLTVAVLTAIAVRWWQASRPMTGPGQPAHAQPGPYRPVPPWLVPTAVALGSVLLTLYRPGVTPDHPWADRRLVPVVLPATVLAATAAAAWATRLAGRRLPGRRQVAIGVGAVLALLVPPAVATAPLATSRTEIGEPATVTRVCSALARGDVVVMVSDATGGVRAQNEWVQVVRGVCGRPAAALTGTLQQQRDAARRLAALVQGAGHRLVLLSADENDGQAAAALTAMGAHPIHAVVLTTREDQRALAHRPSRTSTLVLDVWLALWPTTPNG